MSSQASRWSSLCQVRVSLETTRLRKVKSVELNPWVCSAHWAKSACPTLWYQKYMRTESTTCLKMQSWVSQSFHIWTSTMRLSSCLSRQTVPTPSPCVAWRTKWQLSMTARSTLSLWPWRKVTRRPAMWLKWPLSQTRWLPTRPVSLKMWLSHRAHSGCKICSWTQVSARSTTWWTSPTISYFTSVSQCTPLTLTSLMARKSWLVRQKRVRTW